MPASSSGNLVASVFDCKSLGQKPTRDGYGEGLLELGETEPRVVALCADLTESTRTEAFAKKFPERFIEIGVAEQNLATVAAGLANYGKIPFIASYATFSPGRNWEQIRTTVCYNDVPVKIAGSHAGLSVGPDGATHQALEDIAITRVLPNMTVIVPCDAVEARKATLAAVATPGPVYLRLAREKTPVFTTIETPFTVGQAEVFHDPSFASSFAKATKDKKAMEGKEPGKLDVAIIACGPLVYQALQAAAELEQQGTAIRVINCHTVKPIDEATIVRAAQDAGVIVTVEEHQINGGLGSAVVEVLAKHCPVPVEFVGVQDHFGESGEPSELLKKFGLDVPDIVAAAQRAVSRKSYIDRKL